DLDEGLNPGEKDCVGYTMKTLGAGFWALRHGKSYQDGILRIIHEGGD
ncbi:MAG TPA: ADP-ribosylglycohydrolase family protein, partial [Cyanobacteria bacterium UBA11149]|nr:ADP-ribosylglycohydrolase family protein [Cyanobacteria bacterium UBA11149]